MQLQISETRDLTIALEVGGAQETVTVTAVDAGLNSSMQTLGRRSTRSGWLNCRWFTAIPIP